MWNNLPFQLLLLLSIFIVIHSIHIRINNEKHKCNNKLSTKRKSLQKQNTNKGQYNKPRVQFSDKTQVHNYNLDTPEIIYKKTQKLDDSFLYSDIHEPKFSESRSENVVAFKEYPDNCGDERTIAEIHDEFLHRNITIEMDEGDVNGIYKDEQYEINDNIKTMGYSDFATY